MSDHGPLLFRTREDPFSNFYPADVEIDGRIYPTVEHYYQAQKFATHPDIYDAVTRAPYPDEAKRLSREHKDRVRADWEQIKEDVMVKAVRAKFARHAGLRQILLASGERELIEDSPNDAYWGMIKGRGQNRLGRILMAIRDELRKRTAI